jgi:hypothetical protein
VLARSSEPLMANGDMGEIVLRRMEQHERARVRRRGVSGYSVAE